MADVVLDTGPLADFLVQFFEERNGLRTRYEATSSLPAEAVQAINRIASGNSDFVIVTSAFTFVELARIWGTVIIDRVSQDQLAAFIEDPPEWFVIDPVDEDLLPAFGDVPASVQLSENSVEQIEWTDAVHAATTLARGNARLVTTDTRLQCVDLLRPFR